jgi:acylpyruvate hydrolase
MKIIVVENNFITENSSDNIPPHFYLKPDVSIIRNNQAFYYPEPPKKAIFSCNFVVKTNRLGKTVSKKFAHRYFNEFSIGINFFMVQGEQCTKNGCDSIESITLFDNSLQIGKLVEKSVFPDLSNLNFRVFVNDNKVIDSNTINLELKIDEIIPFVSKYLTIKMGDYILAAFPFKIDNFKPGDRIKASIEDHFLLDFMIR